jgi:alpha-N-arabinofuranosidase
MKIVAPIFFSLLIVLFLGKYSQGGDNIVTVFCSKEEGFVNKNVMGTNIMGNVTRDRRNINRVFREFSDYGAGIWNPVLKQTNEVMIRLAKNAGISNARFVTLNHYDWKKSIGTGRRNNLFGIDEFMKSVAEIGAEPIITLSYFNGNEQDAAELVEYLNAPADVNHPWAMKRAENGHPEPYGVTYFELGNEAWRGDFTKDEIRRVTPSEYARKYELYQNAMKAVDASVKLGLTLYIYSDDKWDIPLIKKIGKDVDFIVRHVHPPHDLGIFHIDNYLRGDELFRTVLASPIVYTEANLDQTLRLFEKYAGRNDVYYVIDEYNLGVVQEKPVPYRFSLGAALVNAELLRIFMKPSHKVLMASQWNFSNGHFGMLKSVSSYMETKDIDSLKVIKRPTYFVYELYNRHFGEVLLETEVTGRSYDISKYDAYLTKYLERMHDRETSGTENLLDKSWHIRKIYGVKTKNKDEVLTIEFKNPLRKNYGHAVKSARIEANSFYKLSGHIMTEGLSGTAGASLEIVDGRGWNKTKSAVSTEKRSGNSPWKYVTAFYKTLADAESVIVMVRVRSMKEPLRGKVRVRDVRLEKIIKPPLSVPYLSVNASRNRKGDRLYLMIINKNMNQAEKVKIVLDECPSVNDAETWVLNGQSVETTNENDQSNVVISHEQINAYGDYIDVTLEPHSMTAIELDRRL